VVEERMREMIEEKVGLEVEARRLREGLERVRREMEGRVGRLEEGLREKEREVEEVREEVERGVRGGGGEGGED
jgi:regulator of replication initiation timing